MKNKNSSFLKMRSLTESLTRKYDKLFEEDEEYNDIDPLSDVSYDELIDWICDHDYAEEEIIDWYGAADITELSWDQIMYWVSEHPDVEEYLWSQARLDESKQSKNNKRKLTEDFGDDIEEYEDEVIQIFGKYGIESQTAKDILGQIKLLLTFKNIESLADLDDAFNHKTITGFYDAEELVHYWREGGDPTYMRRATTADLVDFSDPAYFGVRFPEEIKDIIKNILKKEGWYTPGSIYYYKNEDLYWRIKNHWGDIFDDKEKK